MKRIGEFLKNAREAAGLTQHEVAERAGLTAAYVSQVESGRRADPQFSTIVKMCTALRITTDHVASEVFSFTGVKREKIPSRSKTISALRSTARGLRSQADAIEAVADALQNEATHSTDSPRTSKAR